MDEYYRIRGIGGNPFPLERKELFHIPYSKNYLIGTERYSMPGHSCLYLASQAELAWHECGKPEEFAIAKFSIPQEEENCLKFIDFSEKLMPLKHSFFCWFHNENDKEAVRKYLLKYIYTYPLRAACSVVVQHHGARFIEEYIIPQLLLQWVRNDEDFDGIRYESCSDSDEVKSYGGHNIVLMTKQFDTDGYDIKLRECIKIGVPEKFDINNLKCDERLVDLLDGKELSSDPFLWGIRNLKKKISALLDWLKEAHEELSKPQAPNLAQLLSEYYSVRNAGAWSQKAKIGNLKEFNEIVNYLMQNKLTTPEELQDRVSALSGRIDTLKSSMRGKSGRMKELDELLRMVQFYTEGKPIADKLATIKWKGKREQFMSENENALRLYHMAERKLKPHFKDGKLPMTAWRKERDRLEQEYKTEQAELSPIHAEVKKLWQIKYKVEQVIHEQERQNAVTRQKKQEIEH